MVTFRSVTPDKQEPIRDAANLFDVAVDPKNGNLYAVLQDYEFHGVEEVAFLMSTDGGEQLVDSRSGSTRPRPPPIRCAGRRSSPRSRSGPVACWSSPTTTSATTTDTGELADYWAVFCDPGKVELSRQPRTGATRYG